MVFSGQIEVRSSVGIELDVRPIVDMYDTICLQWMDSYEAAKMAQSKEFDKFSKIKKSRIYELEIDSVCKKINCLIL